MERFRITEDCTRATNNSKVQTQKRYLSESKKNHKVEDPDSMISKLNNKENEVIIHKLSKMVSDHQKKRVSRPTSLSEFQLKDLSLRNDAERLRSGRCSGNIDRSKSTIFQTLLDNTSNEHGRSTQSDNPTHANETTKEKREKTVVKNQMYQCDTGSFGVNSISRTNLIKSSETENQIIHKTHTSVSRSILRKCRKDSFAIHHQLASIINLFPSCLPLPSSKHLNKSLCALYNLGNTV